MADANGIAKRRCEVVSGPYGSPKNRIGKTTDSIPKHTRARPKGETGLAGVFSLYNRGFNYLAASLGRIIVLQKKVPVSQLESSHCTIRRFWSSPNVTNYGTGQ